MKTITIGNAPSLTKDHYEDEMELKIELQVAQNTSDIELTEEQERDLKERLSEAEKDGFKGMSEKEFWNRFANENA